MQNQIAAIMNKDTGLWVGGENGSYRLHLGAFDQLFPACPFFPIANPTHFVRGGSKTRIGVMIEPLTLVRNLMDQVKWMKFFPCIIVDQPRETASVSIEPETVHETIEMEASFQVLSPPAPVVKSRLIRTCCKVLVPTGSYEWMVFDLPEEFHPIPLNCVRACLVQKSEVAGASIVTWIEMAQYPRDLYHNEYQGMLGSVRWAESLARECRQPSINSFITEDFKDKQLTVLAPMITRKFYLGIASATPPLNNNVIRMGVFIGFNCSATDDSDNYMTAARMERVNGAFGEVFEIIHSQNPPHFGERDAHVPSHNFHNYVGLYLHNGDPKQKFMRQCIRDPSGATFITSLVPVRLLTKKTLTEKDEGMVFETFGYALFPDGNTGRTIMTVASLFDVSALGLNRERVEGNDGLMNRAAAAINAAIAQITDQFPA